MSAPVDKPMMPPVTMTVIVLNYNAGAYLRDCVQALAAQSFVNFHAIIADNGSTDSSFDDARSALDDPRFSFVEFGTNHGFARGNNLAVKMVETPLVALLNPDAIPEPGWLDALDRAQLANPGADSFGSLQLDLKDPSRLDGAGDNYLALGVPWRGGHGRDAALAPPLGAVFSACAAAALYRADAFRALGGFDEDYFCYVEDVDLGFRLRLRGGACLQIPDAVVAHAGGVSSGSQRSDFAVYHGTRNMIWTFVKNMPGPLFWILAPGHVFVLGVLLLKASLRGEGGRVYRAIRDACCGLSGAWAKRQQVQATRTATLSSIAAILAWNVFAYFRKDTIVRNIDVGSD
ncbi:MAG: glycosyltransferase family 2 protein [Alphaproteobacteria bacterium]|nr:glycosyltransferase family 2 protein [Alphaproteobacteria bacterium]